MFKRFHAMRYYRKNLLILSITIFLASASWTQVVPFLPKFLAEMGLGRAALHTWSGVIFAVPAIAGILFQPYWIKLGDKYGRKPMVIRAGICLATLYFFMSLCRTPIQLAVVRVLIGGLTGFIPGSIALIATNTPREEAPKSLAIAQSASATGQIAGPSIGLAMYLAAGGYRGSMRISCVAVALSTLMVFLVEEPNKAVDEKTSMLQDLSTALRSRLLTALMLPVFLEGAFATAVLSQLALHLQRLTGHPPVWYEGLIYSGPALAMAGTAYAWSRLGHKIGYTKTLHFGLIGTAISCLALTFVRSIWMFLPIYFTAGVFLASIFPSMGAVLVTQVDNRFRARAYGVLAACASLGAFVAPFFAGQVAAEFGTQYVFTFVGSIFLVGTVLYPVMLRRSCETESDLETAPVEILPSSD
ncbi:MAG TPA: MFS transporter [Armatimonadota bacterium]